MTFIQKTLLSLGLVLVPASVLAAPTNVMHVETLLEDGVLHVSWEAANDDAGIDFYRVYFSHESILDHEGNYDDSVRSDGDGTTYAFNELPLKSEKIYVAILAVNKDGTESEGFESEAFVDVPPPADTAIPMTLDDIHADSEMGVLLTFNKQVSTTTQFTPEFFVLTDLDGVVLEIESVEVRDATILLHTKPQDPVKEYLLSIVQPIPAEDGTNVATMDTPMHWMAFGHQDAPPEDQQPQDIPYEQNPAEQPQGPPEDAVDLALKAMRRSDGTYNVVASWGKSEDSKHTLNSYVLYTSKDGDSFDRSLMVSMNQTSVQYTAVPAGVFGLKVTSKDTLGNESGGIQSIIMLPQSGIGLFGITALSGLIAERRMRRRKSC